jgi:surface antigen
MNRVRGVVFASLALALAGCASSASLVGGSPHMIGGLAGTEIGKSLSAGDRGRALAAEYRALEYGRAGATTPWSDSLTGRYGEVVPGASYKVNDTTCREYVHVIVAGGRSETGRGTACRSASGNWQTVH